MPSLAAHSAIHARTSPSQLETTKSAMKAQLASQMTMRSGQTAVFDRFSMNFANRRTTQATATETNSQVPPETCRRLPLSPAMMRSIDSFE